METDGSAGGATAVVAACADDPDLIGRFVESGTDPADVVAVVSDTTEADPHATLAALAAVDRRGEG